MATEAAPAPRGRGPRKRAHVTAAAVVARVRGETMGAATVAAASRLARRLVAQPRQLGRRMGGVMGRSGAGIGVPALKPSAVKHQCHTSLTPLFETSLTLATAGCAVASPLS